MKLLLYNKIVLIFMKKDNKKHAIESTYINAQTEINTISRFLHTFLIA